MKLDYLYGTPFWIEQKKDMYHFNSDTEYLGKMMSIAPGEAVLDVGCNSGALLLFASQYTNDLTGIDVFEEVIDLAKENMERNYVSAQLYVSKVQDFQHEPFDVIVCNPPYFHTTNEKLKNENAYIRAARHEEYLPLRDLMESCARLLKETGSLQIVHRASRMEEIIACAKLFGLYVTHQRVSYDHRDGLAKACVLFFEKKEKKVVQYAPAYMDDRDSFSRKEEMK